MWLQHRLDSSVWPSSPSGQRAIDHVPRNRGKNTTLIASLSLDGLGASMIMQGAANGAAFEAYVEHILLPSLHKGQVVVMDNLRVHKSARVRQLIEDQDCQVLFLPAYSPDFSPIEEAFSKVKTFLRRMKARTREALERSHRPSAAHRYVPGCSWLVYARGLSPLFRKEELKYGSIPLLFAVVA